MDYKGGDSAACLDSDWITREGRASEGKDKRGTQITREGTRAPLAGRTSRARSAAGNHPDSSLGRRPRPPLRTPPPLQASKKPHGFQSFPSGRGSKVLFREHSVTPEAPLWRFEERSVSQNEKNACFVLGGTGRAYRWQHVVIIIGRRRRAEACGGPNHTRGVEARCAHCAVPGRVNTWRERSACLSLTRTRASNQESVKNHHVQRNKPPTLSYKYYYAYFEYVHEGRGLTVRPPDSGGESWGGRGLGRWRVREPPWPLGR